MLSVLLEIAKQPSIKQQSYKYKSKNRLFKKHKGALPPTSYAQQRANPASFENILICFVLKEIYTITEGQMI